MSLENFKTREKPSPLSAGEGRREQAGKQPAPAQRSGGVCVDSTSVSKVRESREVSGDGNTKSQAPVQAGHASKSGDVAGEVGVSHSSCDLFALDAAFRAELRQIGQRGGTYSTRRGEAKDAGMAGATRIATPPEKIRKLQIALYRKAKAEPKYRFWSLYGELCRRDLLQTALEAQLRNGGSAGVDNESLESICANETTCQQWLDRLQDELKTKRYRPSPVKRVLIPKSSGGERPLGIPTVKDRVVQTALYLVLMPIWEADFHPHSYGFRPKRRAHQAIDAIVEAVHHGYVEIIDADLSKYFDTIPHRELLRMVARRISDGTVLRLIKSWLRAPVVEYNQEGGRRVIPNRCGSPQGGVISPLLANLYLNPLDHGVNGQCVGQARMIRYADDFVIACRLGQAPTVLERTKRWLRAKGLTLNEAKTRLVDIHREGINFLGFNLTWRRSLRGRMYLHVEPGQKSRRALREKLGDILNHWTHWKSIAEVVEEANKLLRGWAGYFHYRNSTSVMSQMNNYSRNRLRRWLWRKHDCSRALWAYYTNQRLHTRYGLHALPTTAAWKAT
jgi:group II intron reverse transcriptase/maturase